MARAEEALSKGDFRAGQERQQAALEALKAASRSLEERARRMRDKSAERAAELAAAERTLRDRAEKAAQAARALQPQTEAAKKAAGAAAEALTEAQRKMGEAAESAQGGDSGKAGASQASAEESLEKASEALEQAAGETGNDPEAKKRLRDLKAEQDDLRKQLKDLQNLLEKIKNPGATAAAQGAETKMDDASRQLDSGGGKKAEQSAEEARRYLEQAKQDLEREKRRYEDLRRDEVLFRLVQDLKEFHKEQQRIRDATGEVSEAAAQGGGNISRAHRRVLENLSKEELQLRTRVDERKVAVEKEDSISFAGGLANVSVDMAEIARLLEERQYDGHVRGIEDEVLHQLADLIGAFEDEFKGRQKPEQSKPGEPQPQGGKQPLVPPMVEVKLMRRLQNDVNAKVDSFWKQNPDVREGRIDERRRRTLERLYNQQSRIRADLEKLIKSIYARQGG
jgi:hypothetical protein